MRTTQAFLVFTASTMLTCSVIGLPVESHCKGLTDLVFLLDASNNVWLPDFRHQLDFIRQLIDWFTIGRETFRVSVVTYADYPQIQVLLSEHDSKADLQAAIDGVDQTGGYHTHGGDALRYMREFVFQDVPDEASSTRIGVIVTNGLMDDHDVAVEQSALSRNAGVHLFAIGVGDSVNVDELDEISSRPARNFTFTVESYSALMRLSRTLAARICEVTTRTESYQRKLSLPINPEMQPGSSKELRAGVVEMQDHSSLLVVAPDDGKRPVSTSSVSASRDEERLVDDYLTDAAVDDGFEEVPSEAIQNRNAIEISDGPPGSGPGNTEGWYWRYDEHGSKVWYRTQGTGLDVDANRKKVVNEEVNNGDPSIVFPPTYHPPSDHTTPHSGYWLVDEQGNHVWYRYDGPGRYVRDSTVDTTPSLNVHEHEGRLTWSGTEDMYWTVDTYGHRVWYKLVRRDDGHGEWFSRIDGDLNVDGSDGKNGSTLVGGGQVDDAPHVYLSSGPGGRGGYWDIDEHGHYVWYHFVAPNLFERDESTATDVMSVPPGYQRPVSQQLRTPPKRTPTGELRRRPGKELNPGWGRPIKPIWLTRPTPGKLTPATTAVTEMSTTSLPSTPGRGSQFVRPGVEPSNRGFWVLDTNGKMTWRSYLEVSRKSGDSEQETIADDGDDLVDWRPSSTKIPRTGMLMTKATQSLKAVKTLIDLTTPSTTVTTTERPTTTTTTTVGSTPSSTQEPREKPNGYWSRGKSGKMEWHTFGPIRQSTVTTTQTITQTTPAPPPPTTTTIKALAAPVALATTKGFATTHLATSSIGTTSSSTLPSTVVTNIPTWPASTSNALLDAQGMTIDEDQKHGLRQTFRIVDSTVAIPKSAAVDSYSTDAVRGTTSTERKDFSLITRKLPVTVRSNDELSSTIATTITASTADQVDSTSSSTSTASLTTELWNGVTDYDKRDNFDTATEKLISHEAVAANQTNRGVVDALGETLRKLFFGNEVPLTETAISEHSVNIEGDDVEVIQDIITSMNNTAIREAVRHQLIADGDETESPTVATTTQQSLPTPTEVDPNNHAQEKKTEEPSPPTNIPTTWHVTRNAVTVRGNNRMTEKLTPVPPTPAGVVNRRGKSGGQGPVRNSVPPVSRKRPQTNYAAKAWEQFIKDVGRDGGDGHPAVDDSETTDVIRRQNPGTGVRQVVGVRRRPSGTPSRLFVRNRGSKMVSSMKPTDKPTPTASSITSAASSVCRPRNPLDIIFAIDQRSTSPTHASHLWQIAFSVMSAVRIDDTRIRVRFIPEMIDGRHHQPASGGVDRNQASRQPIASAGHRPVSEIINELADSMRQETKMAPGGVRRKDEKYRRRVGIYVTDGRSADTAGTVLAAEEATANFGRRRVDLVAVGVGPEVSETQLISVARGRRDRLLTAYRRAHGGQQVIPDVRAVSLRLLQILCDEEQR